MSQPPLSAWHIVGACIYWVVEWRINKRAQKNLRLKDKASHCGLMTQTCCVEQGGPSKPRNVLRASDPVCFGGNQWLIPSFSSMQHRTHPTFAFDPVLPTHWEKVLIYSFAEYIYLVKGHDVDTVKLALGLLTAWTDDSRKVFSLL